MGVGAVTRAVDGATGDPGSVSQLGGALRSQAQQLLRQRQRLVGELDGLRRRPSPADASVTRQADAALRLLDASVDALDRVGTTLQGCAQELTEIAGRQRALERSVAAAGLGLDGLVVVEPWGVLPADSALERRSAAGDLQDQADRLASQLGRARAAVVRASDDAGRALARAATANRESLGR